MHRTRYLIVGRMVDCDPGKPFQARIAFRETVYFDEPRLQRHRPQRVDLVYRYVNEDGSAVTDADHRECSACSRCWPGRPPPVDARLTA